MKIQKGLPPDQRGSPHTVSQRRSGLFMKASRSALQVARDPGWFMQMQPSNAHSLVDNKTAHVSLFHGVHLFHF